jgi:colanic acid biosynthesis glycosyl transferase WcaI
MSIAARSETARTLLIICQVYPPDPAAVGQQVADAAEAMVSRGWRVVVYTSRCGYEDPSQRFPASELRKGVVVKRLPFSSFGKRSIAVRLIAQTFFMIQAIARGLLQSRLTLILVSTSPPFAGFGGAIISWVRRTPFVWWVMDLNPDQMIVAGRLSPRSWATLLFNWMNRVTLRRASSVVVLDRFMRDRVLAKVPVAPKTHVVPPWPHNEIFEGDAGAVAAFRAEHELSNSFVVMYSGNHAIQHPLSTLLDAARQLETEGTKRFIFIGNGAGKADVEDRIAAGATNLRSLPFQPLASIGASLSAADVHVVSMGDEVVGIVHPCKIYGALAVGKPILFFGPPQSHAGDILLNQPFGRVIAHGDTAGAVMAIREFAAMTSVERAELGAQAAEIALTQFSQRHSLSELCNLLEQAVSSQR